MVIEISRVTIMAAFFLPCSTVFFLFSFRLISTSPPSEPPLIQGHPFVVIWNAPTERCKNLDIPLDTAAFQAVTTPAAVPGQFLTLFYENRLGLYPHVDINQTIYHGGIPQNANLTKHLAIVKHQIDQYISQGSPPGLAVIDWESWGPLWDQNKGSKSIYQNLSIAHALQIAPSLSSDQIFKLAKEQFQLASRRFMEETISVGIREHPNCRWGFYLFPDCHNYNWDEPGYTGQCSVAAQKQNDEMLWLWKRSTAFFPSVYLHLGLRNSPQAALFVRHRVQEAMRVAALPNRPHMVPIFVYSRPLYRNQIKMFETLADLISTIGESAALGASGVVMWGSHKDYNNKVACQSLSKYLTSTLNPYIANVTAAAILCSEVLCQGKGRCIRKNFNSSHYLHLNPIHFHIVRDSKNYLAIGLPSAADLQSWAEHFTCQCYVGESCSPKLLHSTKRQVIKV